MLREPIESISNQLHGDVRPAENALENDCHEPDEHNESPHSVCHDPVDSVAGCHCRAFVLSHRFFTDLSDPIVPRLDEYRLSIKAKEIQLLMLLLDVFDKFRGETIHVFQH